jgi:hypothetical protein
MASPNEKLVIEHRMWSAQAQEQQQLRPPYAYDMQVTPISKYADPIWKFPPEWLPAGSRNRQKLMFLEKAFIEGVQAGLFAGKDDILIDQLKQTMCFIIFSGEMMDRRIAVATIHGRFSSLKKIFVAAKVAGFSSLGEIDAISFQKVRALLPAVFNESLLLALNLLLRSCKSGFVVDGITDYEIEVESEARTFDTTNIAGEEVLSDEEYAKLVDKACILFDHYDEYKVLVRNVWNDRSTSLEVREWLAVHFPKVASLRVDGIRNLAPRLLQTSAAMKLGFAFGPRPNELLSLEIGFLRPDDVDPKIHGERITFEVSKNKKDYPGFERTFPVDPVWELEIVQDALEFVYGLYGGTSNRLFTGPKLEGEISTSQLILNIKEFCRLAGCELNVTGYSARTTLISHTAQSLDGGLTQAQLAVEHRSKRTTAAYALSSPSVRQEIYQKSQSLGENRTTMLLEQTEIMGGPGLQGEQGRRIEQSLTRALDASSGVITKKEVAEQFLEETNRRKIYPLPVMPGVFCFKPLPARGECSKRSNDLLPDVGRCSPRCPYGVQMEYRRELVRHEIMEIIPTLPAASNLQREYWLRQIADQLVAWPDLEPDLRIALEGHPELLEIIGTMRSQK